MPKDWEPRWREETGWEIDFTVEGQRVRRRLGIRDRCSKAIALKQAEAIYRRTWEHCLAPVKPAGTPFSRAARGYIEAGGEARYLPAILRQFGPDLMIEDVDEALIVETGAALYPTCQPDTIRRQVRVPISAVVRWAKGQRRRPSTDNRRVRWLTPEEAEALITAAAKLTLPRHSAPEPFTLAKIAFLLGSGCRTGECFEAGVSDWNPGTRQWWIPGDAKGAGKTAGAARWVRLPARSVDLFGTLPEVGRAFLTAYGKPIVTGTGSGGQMQTAFNKARDLAGLGGDVTPHVLRHTWATWFYAQTRDFGALMDQGGWAKADMANRYRKLAPDDLADRLLAFGWDFRQESVNMTREAYLSSPDGRNKNAVKWFTDNRLIARDERNSR